MASGKGLRTGLVAFLVDYGQRHAHPVNAILHLLGVPMVFISVYYFITGSAGTGLALFTGGYLLQYLGHRAQGNEVGEVTLIKHIWHRLLGSKEARIESE